MPVWQQFHETHQEQAEILSVAMDAQGADKARPYVEKAGAQFATVVDEGNLLGQLYGFKAIPNGFLIDEEGILRHKRLGGFDIRKPATASIVDQWISALGLDESLSLDELELGPEHSQANEHFRQGQSLYKQGNVRGALDEWRKGTALEPDNLIIRKQLWVVENPGRFYDGNVDYAWQEEQMLEGR